MKPNPRYLVDAYNLMHAVGLAVAEHNGPKAMEAARKRYLDWIADRPALRQATVKPELRLIFDAQNSHQNFGTHTHRGIVVTFSFGETADDFIETLIAREPHPESLAVVSNDHRLQHAAKRGRCTAMSCESFIDWLETVPAAPTLTADPHRPAKEKPSPSEADIQEFLDVFSKPR